MISAAEIVESLIRDKALLEEALAQGIINYSSLARKLRPQVEKRLLKNVEDGSIIMALKRLSEKLTKTTSKSKILKELGDITIRSNLIEFTFVNSDSFIKSHLKLMNKIADRRDTFLTVSHGVNEVTVIASANCQKDIEEVFVREKSLSQSSNLSSLTIKLSANSRYTPGVFYSLLKLLAWDGINVVEAVSTFSELTIVLDNKDIDRAFTIIKNQTVNHEENKT